MYNLKEKGEGTVIRGFIFIFINKNGKLVKNNEKKD